MGINFVNFERIFMRIKDKKFMTVLSVILLSTSVFFMVFLFLNMNKQDNRDSNSIQIVDITAGNLQNSEYTRYILDETALEYDDEQTVINYISDTEKSNTLEDIINSLSKESGE